MSTTALPDADAATEILEEPDWGQPENACDNYERCGNIVPYNGQVCGECLDRAVNNG